MTTPSTTRLGTDPAGRPVLRLRGPSDLVEAIPFLVGFRPVCSVVVVALGGTSRRLVMTARVDIDDRTTETLAAAWGSAVREGASAVLVSLHDDAAAQGLLPHRELAAALRTAAEAAGLEVLDVLCVGAERFWSYACDRPDCCPPEGRPVEKDGVVAAEMVVQGLPRAERREDLEREVASDPERAARVGEKLDQLPASGATTAGRRAAGVALLDQLVRSATTPLDDATAAQALQALADVSVRDTQLHRRAGADAERAARLWADLAQAAPDGFRAAPLTMLAISAYVEGQGARANIALEAAVSDRPGYSLARLLGSAIAAALPPRGIVDALDDGARATRRELTGALSRPRRRRRRGGS